MRDLTAFVLAGGKSSRMGWEKAFLELEGSTLLERTLTLAGKVADPVYIVGPRKKFGAWGNVVEDEFVDQGPLGGIHAALGCGGEANLVLAVDMPFLEPEFLQVLATTARTSQAVVTVPRVGGRYQTLCAIYRREFRSLAEQALREGRNRVDALYGSTTVRIIGEEEFQAFAFDAAMFDNLNSRDDLDHARGRGSKG